MAMKNSFSLIFNLMSLIFLKAGDRLLKRIRYGWIPPDQADMYPQDLARFFSFFSMSFLMTAQISFIF